MSDGFIMIDWHRFRLAHRIRSRHHVLGVFLVHVTFYILHLFITALSLSLSSCTRRQKSSFRAATSTLAFMQNKSRETARFIAHPIHRAPELSRFASSRLFPLLRRRRGLRCPWCRIDPIPPLLDPLEGRRRFGWPSGVRSARIHRQMQTGRCKEKAIQKFKGFTSKWEDTLQIAPSRFQCLSLIGC